MFEAGAADCSKAFLMGPAVSAENPLQDGAEPDNDADGASLRTQSRKSKACTAVCSEEKVRNSPMSTKLREEGAGGGAPSRAAVCPAAHGEATVEQGPA